MAMKNLLRYKKRTLMTSLSLAIGILTYILFHSILGGANTSSIRSYVYYESSAGKVVTEAYFKEKELFPVEYSFDPTELGQTLDENNISWAGRVGFNGTLVLNEYDFKTAGSIPFSFYGIDVNNDTNVFNLQQDMKDSEGEWLESNQPQAVIGSNLAHDLGAELGSTITILTKTKTGFNQAMDLSIVGILTTEDAFINSNGIYIPLDYINTALEMGGTVTEVNIRANSSQPKALAKYNAKVSDVVSSVANVEYHPWKDWAQAYLAASKTDADSSAFLLFAIAIIACIGIINTQIMAIFERVREIGIMLAMGISKAQIRMLFLFEGLFIGILSAGVGSILAALFNIFLVKKGFDLSFLLDHLKDGDIGYRLSSSIYGVWTVDMFLSPIIFSIILTMAVSWIATRRINKMNIISCLRYQ